MYLRCECRSCCLLIGWFGVKCVWERKCVAIVTLHTHHIVLQAVIILQALSAFGILNGQNKLSQAEDSSCLLPGCYFWKSQARSKSLKSDSFKVKAGAEGKRNQSCTGVKTLTNVFLCYLSSRIASLSKIFPTLMLYKLWEDGKIGSLDDPLEKYVDNFTIKNPLGKTRDSELKYVTDGLIFLDSGEVQIRSSSVTLRRMASQLSGTEHHTEQFKVFTELPWANRCDMMQVTVWPSGLRYI